MIKFVEGDMFDGPEFYKVHQVNCQGVMGAGIAKTVKDNYPNVYKNYKHACDLQKSSSDLLGKVQVVKVTDKDFYIVNLFGQDNYHSLSGRCTNYEAFYTCLEKLRDYINNTSNNKTVAFPYKIASNLAGGDWNVINAMITSVFENTDIDVTIYVYKPKFM